MKKRRTTLLIILCVFILTAATGCKQSGDDVNEVLVSKIDLALETLNAIEMKSENHPWEVMHGIYLFGTDYEIYNVDKKKNINALKNVCCIETAREFIQVEDGGPLFVSEIGRAEADTHRNMFLSILSAADVPLYHQFHAFDGNIYPLWRFLDKAMLEIDWKDISGSEEVVLGNYGNELGWTLSAFTKYLPLDHKWKNKKGEWINTEDILEVAVKRPQGWGTCFGTHELYGIAAAVNRREMSGLKLEGGWLMAREYLDSAIQLVKENQNPDGSLSIVWYKEQKTPKAPKYMIYATGHTLEWLVLALPREELEQEWVFSMAEALSLTITDNFDDIKNSHSISTHAGHALMMYKQKLNGE